MEFLQVLLTEQDERVLELKVSGEIDLATVVPLREATRAAARSGDYDALVVDLLGVDFIDSSGLHVLVEANRAMVEQGGEMTIVCASLNVLKVFELTGLDRVLTIVCARAEAYAVAA